jgi:hypothetical protein
MPPSTKSRNAFISFHIADEAQVNLLRAQAKSERFELTFRDFSVNEPFDSAWKQQCRERIAQTSVTICMIGQDTHEREAVAWELETSYELGHKTVGVRIYRDQAHKLPQILISRGAPILDWDIAAIVRELEVLSVRCGATTRISGNACRNRVLGKPPCWQHAPEVPASEPSAPSSEGPLDVLREMLRRLTEIDEGR